MKLRIVLGLLLATAPAAAQELALRPFEREGLAAFSSGDNATCARIFSAAARKHRGEPSPPFVAARCYARLGDTANARKQLALALQRGYRKCDNLGREEGLAKLADLRARCESNAEAWMRATNAELLAAYLADRADRTGEIEDVDAVLRRDAGRRDVVKAAIQVDALRTADDYFHAATVMQHGSDAGDFALARELAKKAVALRPWFAEARWLYAAATDRWLHATGKPQIYGTQYAMVNGKWSLEPFDANALTDEERASWRVQSVAERRKFIDELNQQSQ